jgi:hypothetical protein
MKRLSDDALWLWEAFDGWGAESPDNDALRQGLEGDDEPWSPARFESAINELEARGILSRAGGTVEPACIEQETAAVSDGVLVSVRVKVFSDVELELPIGVQTLGLAVDEVAASLVRSGRPVPHRTERALYWCSTEDGNEDWFVIAPCALLARSFFEEYEGYDIGDAQAEWVADVPDSVKATDESIAEWPSLGVIKQCGGELLSYQPDMDAQKVKLREAMGVATMAIRFNDRVFVAGDIVENTFRRERRPGSSSDN